MDWARRPYTTTARFFRNSPLEIKVKWLPADLSKGPLPFPSRICSQDWSTEPHRAVGPGEVWNTDRDFNRAQPIGPIRGPHVCGTEDEFRNGEVFDPSRPLMEYHPSGIPKCCDDGRREAAGHVAIIGAPHSVRSDPYTSSGKVALLTQTHIIRSDPYTVSGALFVVTYLHIVRSDPYHSEGGPMVKGATQTKREDPYHSEGGPMVKGLSLHIPYPPIIPCETIECCPVMTGHCEGAASACHECWCRFEHTAEVSSWRRYSTTPGKWYRFEIAFDLGNVAGVWTFYKGDICDTKTMVANGSEHPRNQTIDFQATGDFCWWEISCPTTTVLSGYSRIFEIGAP